MTPTQPVSKISLLRAAWTAGDRPGAAELEKGAFETLDRRGFILRRAA